MYNYSLSFDKGPSDDELAISANKKDALKDSKNKEEEPELDLDSSDAVYEKFRQDGVQI